MASPSKRPYKSAVREERAEARRRAVLDAARRRFAVHGFVATTIEAVAKDAGVSAPYVYMTFGSKPALLLELVRELKDAVDVGGRYRALLADPDPRSTLRAVASLTRDWSAAAWDVADVVRAAASASPEAHQVWVESEGTRHRGQLRLCERLVALGHVRLAAEDAADRTWTLTAHDQYRLLVVDRGWTADRYEAWLADVLVRELL